MGRVIYQMKGTAYNNACACCRHLSLTHKDGAPYCKTQEKYLFLNIYWWMCDKHESKYNMAYAPEL